LDEKQLPQPQIAIFFYDEAVIPETLHTIRSQYNGRKNKQDSRNKKETIAQRAAHARTAVEARVPQGQHHHQLASMKRKTVPAPGK